MGKNWSWIAETATLAQDFVSLLYLLENAASQELYWTLFSNVRSLLLSRTLHPYEDDVFEVTLPVSVLRYEYASITVEPISQNSTLHPEFATYPFRFLN